MPANSNGIYSLKTGWLKEPRKEDIPDTVDLEPELSELLRTANACRDIDDIDEFIDDLYKLRQESLLSEGEYGKGNQLFKELRNRGILKDLKERKIELETQDMSLESLDEDVLDEASADKQKFIDKFGQEAFDTFWNNKQRLKNKGISVDILYHVKNTSPEEMQSIIDDLNSTLSKSQQAKKEKREGVDELYEDDRWLIMRVKTYEAARKYCSGTVWCIAGNYDNNVEWGKSMFDHYLEKSPSQNGYTEYILYIDKKNNRKYMAGTLKKDPTQAEVWYEDDVKPIRNPIHQNRRIPGSPPAIPGIPDMGDVITNSNELGDSIIADLKNMTVIPKRYFSEVHWEKNFELVIPDNITAIEPLAFFLCTRLTKCYVPNSVVKIGDDAFMGCNRLREISLPGKFLDADELERIGVKSRYSNNRDNINVAVSESAKLNIMGKGLMTEGKNTQPINEAPMSPEWYPAADKAGLTPNKRGNGSLNQVDYQASDETPLVDKDGKPDAKKAWEIFKQDATKIHVYVPTEDGGSRLVAFGSDGKPLHDNEKLPANFRFNLPAEYGHERRTGELVRDLHYVPPRHLFSIANKISLVDLKPRDRELAKNRRSNFGSRYANKGYGTIFRNVEDNIKNRYASETQNGELYNRGMEKVRQVSDGFFGDRDILRGIKDYARSHLEYNSDSDTVASDWYSSKGELSTDEWLNLFNREFSRYSWNDGDTQRYWAAYQLCKNKGDVNSIVSPTKATVEDTLGNLISKGVQSKIDAARRYGNVEAEFIRIKEAVEVTLNRIKDRNTKIEYFEKRIKEKQEEFDNYLKPGAIHNRRKYLTMDIESKKRDLYASIETYETRLSRLDKIRAEVEEQFENVSIDSNMSPAQKIKIVKELYSKVTTLESEQSEVQRQKSNLYYSINRLNSKESELDAADGEDRAHMKDLEDKIKTYTDRLNEYINMPNDFKDVKVLKDSPLGKPISDYAGKVGPNPVGESLKENYNDTKLHSLLLKEYWKMGGK